MKNVSKKKKKRKPSHSTHVDIFSIFEVSVPFCESPTLKRRREKTKRKIKSETQK